MVFLFYVLSPPNVFAVHRFDRGRGPPIGGQENDRVSYFCSAPYTLLPLRGISPQGETRDMERKTGRHILHVPFRCGPLWWLAPPPFPRKRGHYKTPLCCERLMKGMLRGVLFCPLNRGKSGAARIGGGERSEPVSRMLILPYDTESKSRNVLASPLGEEGHEVAKGCTRVRMIMIFLFYVLSPFAQGAADWRSGPRWSILSVLCPVHPFPLRGTSPRWEACHWIFRSLRSLTNPVPLPPQGETRK